MSRLQSEIRKRQWADPEYRERVRAGRLARKAAMQAERAGLYQEPARVRWPPQLAADHHEQERRR
jgi:hypothetical protein